MSSFIHKLWFNKSPLAYVLLPFAIVYYLVITIRRYCYKVGLLKSFRSNKLVVVVGNIMIGGNGKTPLVIALVNKLTALGIKVAVVSRGYGAHPRSLPFKVTADSPTNESGDEPKLIAMRTNVPVIIDPVRSRAISEAQKVADVIISDDGLQHYAFKRDIEIIVQDGKRRCGNGLLLPAGPLRETKSRLKEVDFVVINGGIAKEGEYKFTLNPDCIYSLAKKHEPKKLNINEVLLNINMNVCALAGIGDPRRFYNTLGDLGFKVIKTIEAGDHQAIDVATILAYAREAPLFMTEKDMVKYADFDLPNCYALAVKPNFLDGFLEELTKKILTSINKGK